MDDWKYVFIGCKSHHSRALYSLSCTPRCVYRVIFYLKLCIYHPPSNMKTTGMAFYEIVRRKYKAYLRTFLKNYSIIEYTIRNLTLSMKNESLGVIKLFACMSKNITIYILIIPLYYTS
ncbi:hypothetical protein RF11_01903 [Thelohanellus kitauei]|uniref:Uncharacterized protein n=1 Tax=Thelohanellus kitauei TaxID=669202 RepID=A0A0C2MYF4_THEKT|nr:hypothetical protein RF11_01903 [Thelohanellus kitauei]